MTRRFRVYATAHLICTAVLMYCATEDPFTAALAVGLLSLIVLRNAQTVRKLKGLEQ